MFVKETTNYAAGTTVCGHRVSDSLVPASLMDRQLAEQAANAGRMLEAAYSVADRELALIWQRTMFDIVKLRRARRFGVDIQGVNGGSA